MRMIGQLKGALTTVATRRSVIFSSDGLELVLTFFGYASVGSPAMKALPSAAAEDFKTPRRSNKCRSGVLMAVCPVSNESVLLRHSCFMRSFDPFCSIHWL